MARFDGAFAQEDAVFVDRQAAGDNVRILIVDGVAFVANVALAVVTGGNLQANAGATIAAILHSISLWLTNSGKPDKYTTDAGLLENRDSAVTSDL
jgi:hypothetical protein